jgi:hypothetical protein
MTNLLQAAKQVVDAWDLGEFSTRMENTITALRQAISQAEQQEPTYWTYVVNGTWRKIDSSQPPDDAYDKETLEPLYTAPPQREWMEPSDEQIASVGESQNWYATDSLFNLARAVLKLAKELNS